MWVSCGSGWSAELAPHKSPRRKKGFCQFLRKYQIIVMLLLAMLNTLLRCQAPCFDMGNHMGPFLWASDPSAGQEQGGWAVGGQGPLQDVKSLFWFWDLILVSHTMFFGMRNHMGPFLWETDRSEVQEQGGGAVGGQGPLQGVKLLFWFWDLILMSHTIFFGMGNHMAEMSKLPDLGSNQSSRSSWTRV